MWNSGVGYKAYYKGINNLYTPHGTSCGRMAQSQNVHKLQALSNPVPVEASTITNGMVPCS